MSSGEADVGGARALATVDLLNSGEEEVGEREVDDFAAEVGDFISEVSSLVALAGPAAEVGEVLGALIGAGTTQAESWPAFVDSSKVDVRGTSTSFVSSSNASVPHADGGETRLCCEITESLPSVFKNKGILLKRYRCASVCTRAVAMPFFPMCFAILVTGGRKPTRPWQ